MTDIHLHQRGLLIFRTAGYPSRTVSNALKASVFPGSLLAILLSLETGCAPQAPAQSPEQPPAVESEAEPATPLAAEVESPAPEASSAEGTSSKTPQAAPVSKEPDGPRRSKQFSEGPAKPTSEEPSDGPKLSERRIEKKADGSCVLYRGKGSAPVPVDCP